MIYLIEWLFFCQKPQQAFLYPTDITCRKILLIKTREDVPFQPTFDFMGMLSYLDSYSSI